MAKMVFPFKYYPELAPACDSLPIVVARSAASHEDETALLDRCCADAAAWAAARGLPRLRGDAKCVRAAEIYRAEWLRQNCSTPRALRRESSALTWLMFMFDEMRDD